MKISLDGGATYIEPPAMGVRAIYDGLMGFDNEEVELHVNITEEGIILDVWDLSNNTHMTTSSEMAQQIVDSLDARQLLINETLRFAHLTKEQKGEIFEEAVKLKFEVANDDPEYLMNMVRDLMNLEDTQEQLESISGDNECVRELLGFDPWEEV